VSVGCNSFSTNQIHGLWHWNLRTENMLATIIYVHWVSISINLTSHYIFSRLFKEKVLMDDSTLPSSYSEAKKVLDPLALPCIKIHACPNDCILYYDEKVNLQECSKCKTRRYTTNLLGHQSPRKVCYQS
jgi:hypothetical protein